MIHVALHWGCDNTYDLNLWLFAIDHTTYVYNILPQRTSGLTPIEFLSSVKTDHRDLRRLHVWECPAFVLEPNTC